MTSYLNTETLFNLTIETTTEFANYSNPTETPIAILSSPSNKNYEQSTIINNISITKPTNNSNFTNITETLYETEFFFNTITFPSISINFTEKPLMTTPKSWSTFSLENHTIKSNEKNTAETNNCSYNFLFLSNDSIITSTLISNPSYHINSPCAIKPNSSFTSSGQNTSLHLTTDSSTSSTNDSYESYSSFIPEKSTYYSNPFTDFRNVTKSSESTIVKSTENIPTTEIKNSTNNFSEPEFSFLSLFNTLDSSYFLNSSNTISTLTSQENFTTTETKESNVTFPTLENSTLTSYFSKDTTHTAHSFESTSDLFSNSSPFTSSIQSTTQHLITQSHISSTNDAYKPYSSYNHHTTFNFNPYTEFPNVTDSFDNSTFESHETVSSTETNHYPSTVPFILNDSTINPNLTFDSTHFSTLNSQINSTFSSYSSLMSDTSLILTKVTLESTNDDLNKPYSSFIPITTTFSFNPSTEFQNNTNTIESTTEINISDTTFFFILNESSIAPNFSIDSTFFSSTSSELFLNISTDTSFTTENSSYFTTESLMSSSYDLVVPNSSVILEKTTTSTFFFTYIPHSTNSHENSSNTSNENISSTQIDHYPSTFTFILNDSTITPNLSFDSTYFSTLISEINSTFSPYSSLITETSSILTTVTLESLTEFPNTTNTIEISTIISTELISSTEINLVDTTFPFILNNSTAIPNLTFDSTFSISTISIISTNATPYTSLIADTTSNLTKVSLTTDSYKEYSSFSPETTNINSNSFTDITISTLASQENFTTTEIKESNVTFPTLNENSTLTSDFSIYTTHSVESTTDLFSNSSPFTSSIQSTTSHLRTLISSTNDLFEQNSSYITQTTTIYSGSFTDIHFFTNSSENSIIKSTEIFSTEIKSSNVTFPSLIGNSTLASSFSTNSNSNFTFTTNITSFFTTYYSNTSFTNDFFATQNVTYGDFSTFSGVSQFSTDQSSYQSSSSYLNSSVPKPYSSFSDTSPVSDISTTNEFISYYTTSQSPSSINSNISDSVFTSAGPVSNFTSTNIATISSSLFISTFSSTIESTNVSTTTNSIFSPESTFYFVTSSNSFSSRENLSTSNLIDFSTNSNLKTSDAILSTTSSSNVTNSNISSSSVPFATAINNFSPSSSSATSLSSITLTQSTNTQTTASNFGATLPKVIFSSYSVLYPTVGSSQTINCPFTSIDSWAYSYDNQTFFLIGTFIKSF